MTDSGNVTGLLQAWRKGDKQALDRLSTHVYQELRRLARRYMAAENARHTLQATALVNEAFLRLIGSDVDYQDRKHFYVVAARVMRRVLVDHARAKSRQKRGDGGPAVTLTDETRLDDEESDMPILILDEALVRLAESDPRMAEAVELIYFGGLSMDEAADALGISKTTIYEDMRFARAWLRNELS